MNNKIQSLSIAVTAADFGASNFVASLENSLLTKLFRERAENLEKLL